jgi:hypothetical protein
LIGDELNNKYDYIQHVEISAYFEEAKNLKKFISTYAQINMIMKYFVFKDGLS